MAILKQIIFIFLALSLTGCYEAFTPQIDTKPVLCMNSLITAGQHVSVSLTRTRLYTDETGDLKVDDATLAIYVNGQLREADYVAQEGDHIRLVAVSKTYGRVEAEVIVPEAVGAESLEWTPVLLNVYKGDAQPPAINCAVSFNLSAVMTVADPPGKENYYRFSYLGYNKHYDSEEGDYTGNFESPYPSNPLYFGMGDLQYNAEPIFAEHIGVFESVMGGDAMGFTFFTDRQFSGSTYPLHLLFTNCQWIVDMKQWDSESLDVGYVFTLHTVSPSYYNWANYQWQRDNGTIVEIGDIGLGNAIWGFSNVSSGAGVVAAQAMKTYTINLRDFLKDAMDQNGIAEAPSASNPS